MSRELEWTPGPYVAEGSDVITKWEDEDGDRLVIAELHCDQESEAKLFAAAPELFDSAKEMRETIIELCQTFDVPLPEATLNRNDAALAKATGGEG